MNAKIVKKLKAETDRLISVYKSGNYAELEKAACRYLKQFPQQAFGWKVLGVALQKLKRYQGAVTAYNSALELNVRDPELYNNLAVVQKELGLLAEAELSVKTALRLSSDYAVAHNTLGNILRGANRIGESLEAYRTAISLNPRLAMAHNNMGNAFKELCRNNEALESYRRALEIDPDFMEARKNLGAILLDMGRHGEALACYADLLQCSSGDSEDLNKLGNVLEGLGRYNEAEVVYRNALTKHPGHAGLHTNLGNVLVRLGRLSEAIACYQAAVTVEPEKADSTVHLAMAVLPTVVLDSQEAGRVPGDFSGALDQLAAYGQSNGWSTLGAAVSVRLPFNLSYRAGNHCELLSRHGDIAATARREWLSARDEKPVAMESPTPGRIRLGIVSAHVRRHSVWYVLLRGLLHHLDRSQFEVIIYHTDTACDSETDLARSLADRFEQGPQDWVTVIRRDAPDILFYPDLAMDPASFELGLLRLAPLQVTTWGHPITSGLPEIDLFFSGELLEGPDARKHYRERLVLLPGTGACSSLMKFDRKPLAADIVNVPEERAVTRFFICQRAMKFDPAFDGLYAEIAQKGGPCHFWFVRDLKIPWASEVVEGRIADTFRAAGLDPDQYLSWVEWVPGDQFWAFMQEMDIYLDTPAFSGFTTAWQALHCGLPVVTMEGEFLRQRLAAGLMRRVGLTETIAQSYDEYVALAVELANDSDKRQGLRLKMSSVAGVADEDLSVIRTLERELIDALDDRKRSLAMEVGSD